MEIHVESPNVTYHDDYIESLYEYQTTVVSKTDGSKLVVSFTSILYSLFFKIQLIDGVLAITK